MAGLRKQRHEAGILQQRLRRQVGQAIDDYSMIGEGDRVMVCTSGGKDSHALLDILCRLRQSAPVHFDVFAVLMDQGQPGFCAAEVEAHFQSMGVEYRIVRQDTYAIVKRVIPEGKTTCGLCSRLRRGVLYRIADEEGADKIALGHHADDIMETLFLNLFHAGALKAMPPRLTSDDGRHTVIRPLAYCRERDLAAYAKNLDFPIIPCNLCGSTGGGARRQVKQLLNAWEREHPGRINSIFSALANVAPSHLLDRALFDFACAHEREREPAPAPTPASERRQALFSEFSEQGKSSYVVS